LQEIPWENIWHPECTIRKHIHVNLLKRDVITAVQVFIDDGKNKLSSEFVWKVKLSYLAWFPSINENVISL